MKKRVLRLACLSIAAALVALPATASAHEHGQDKGQANRGHHKAHRHDSRGHHKANRHDGRHHGKGGVLYTTTNDPAGNAVQVYRRSSDNGSLSLVQTVPTGSPGLAAQPPFTFSIVDSSNSMALARDGRLLFVVNDGDNTITSLRSTGNGLKVVDTAASGGILPISLAVSGNLLYVLNERSASIFAYRFSNSGNLRAIPNSARQLSQPFPSDGAGNPGAAAAQIGFAPGGRQLVVTERGVPTHRGVIDTFAVNPDGTTDSPQQTTATDPNPFGFSFTDGGQLLVSNVGFVGPTAAFPNATIAFPDGSLPLDNVGDLEQFKGSASSYNLSPTGTWSPISSQVLSGGRGACWLVLSKDQKFAFVSNTLATGLPPGTGAGAITTYTVGSDGTLTRLGQTDAHPGNPTDLAVSPDGRFLYMLNPGVFGPPSGIDVFAIGPNGSLTLTTGGVSGVPFTGISGLAVS